MTTNNYLQEALLEHAKAIHFISIKICLNNCLQKGHSSCTFNFLTMCEIQELGKLGYSISTTNNTWTVSLSND